MIWIGLTGSMGSGKSTAAKVLREMGFPVLDADAVVHLLLQRPEVLIEIEQAFGSAIRDASGELDRKALASVAFGSEESRQKLESILHPRVREQVKMQREQLERQGHRAAFYDVPLLFEKKMEDQFQFIFVVSASEAVRRQRLKDRSNLSDKEIDARLSHQLDPKIKEQKASVVIQNEGNEAELKNEITKALQKLKISLPTST